MAQPASYELESLSSDSGQEGNFGELDEHAALASEKSEGVELSFHAGPDGVLVDVKNKSEEALSSSSRAFGNTFISFVGAGILGLPYAFSRGGCMLLLVVSILAYYAMILIVRCRYAVPAKPASSYGEVGRAAFGIVGQVLVDICLVVSQTGFCVAYLIFISTNIHSLLPNFPSWAIIICCIPALVLLTWIRHLKHLAPFSILADVVNIVGLSVVFFNDFEAMSISKQIVSFETSQLAFFFGVAIYCYEGVGMVIPIESSMKEKEKFPLILALTMVLVTGIYTAFGVFGHMAFGLETHEIITMNLPANAFNAVVKVCFCVGLYFTYPIMMFPVMHILEGSLPGMQSPHEWRKNAFRTAIVVCSSLIAIGVPNFSLFISLIGSSCCALLAFILPAAFHLKLSWHSLRYPTIGLDVILMIAGLLGAVLGTIDATRDMLEVLQGEGSEGT